MKIRNLLIVGPLLLLLVLSCDSKQDTYANKVQLVKTGELRLQLDSLTPHLVTSFFYDSLADEFSLANIYTNTIYNYDASSGLLNGKDSYDVEGPNGVGRFSSVTEFVKFGDSTLFYDRVLKKFVITSLEGDLLYSRDFGFTNPDSPYGMWGDWVVKTDAGFDFSGSAVNQSFVQINSGIDSLEFLLDIGSDVLTKSYLPIPTEYYKSKWLTEMLRYHRAYNRHSEEFVYSWPISDSIFRKNKKGEIISSLLGTKNISKPKSLPDNVEPIVTNPTRKANFLFENGYYTDIFYDPYRRMILRIAFSGIEEGMVNMNGLFDNPDHYDMTLILANDNFEKLAEINMDEYESRVIFFKDDGIYILKKTDNEDELTFHRFTVESTY